MHGYSIFLLLSPKVTPFNISLPAHIQGAMIGNSLIVECTVNADSGLDFGSIILNWMGPEGDTITNDSRVTINPTTSSGNTYTSSIQFTYLMEGDEGTYMCNVMILETSGSASVVLGTLTSESYHLLSIHVIVTTIVPEPEVTVTAPNTQTVGQSLTLTCNAVTVRGITSRVDIIWIRATGNNVVQRMDDVTPTTMNSTSLYSVYRHLHNLTIKYR